MTVCSRMERGLRARATRRRARLETRRCSLCRPAEKRRVRAASRIRREARRSVSRLRTVHLLTHFTGTTSCPERSDTRLGTRPMLAFLRPDGAPGRGGPPLVGGGGADCVGSPQLDPPSMR